MFEKIYFEQYVLDREGETIGSTITETGIVLHAGQTRDSFHIIWMPNGIARHY